MKNGLYVYKDHFLFYRLMINKLQISIPKPCHEKWSEMIPEEKGRFCAMCQKTVYDFTKSSDREIINTYNSNKNL